MAITKATTTAATTIEGRELDSKGRDLLGGKGSTLIS